MAWIGWSNLTARFPIGYLYLLHMTAAIIIHAKDCMIIVLRSASPSIIKRDVYKDVWAECYTTACNIVITSGIMRRV